MISSPPNHPLNDNNQLIVAWMIIYSVSSNFKSQDLELESLSLDPERGHLGFLEKQDCKAQCDSLSLSGLFRTALAQNPSPPNTTKKSLTCANQPCRTEWRALISKVPFLPSFLCCLFLSKHHSTSSTFTYSLTFVASPSLLVLHACINRLTTDFRRSCPSLSSSTCTYIGFSFPPLVCSFTEQAHGLCSFCYYWCLLYSTLDRSRGQFSLHWGCQ